MDQILYSVLDITCCILETRGNYSLGFVTGLLSSSTFLIYSTLEFERVYQFTIYKHSRSEIIVTTGTVTT